MQHADTSSEAWYRNPWVWLVIAIPGLTVLGCAFTIYLAVTNPEVLVGDTRAGGVMFSALLETAGFG